jgi:hypothetical protein
LYWFNENGCAVGEHLCHPIHHFIGVVSHAYKYAS